MIYRLDFQHFLTHFIDFFSYKDIINCQYFMITAAISNGAKCRNIQKSIDLYPVPEVVDEYTRYKDKKIMKKMYINETLEPSKEEKENMKKGESYFVYNIIYKSILKPLSDHVDIVLICHQSENDYMDVFCEWLKDKFKVEVIDLNQLFIKGKVGSIYIDRKEIKDNATDIRRLCAMKEYKDKSKSEDGKKSLIKMMRLKEKIKMLKNDFDIKIGKKDLKNIDRILFDAWNGEE